MNAKCILAACVSIRDCRRMRGKGGKERASVEGAVQLPMSIQKKIFAKNLRSLLHPGRGSMCVCVCVCVCVCEKKR